MSKLKGDCIVICWVQRGNCCVKPDKLREMDREEREKREEREERSRTCCFQSFVTWTQKVLVSFGSSGKVLLFVVDKGEGVGEGPVSGDAYCNWPKAGTHTVIGDLCS